MTTGPAGRHSTNEGCRARLPTAAKLRRSRSAGAGSSRGPTPGSTTSASSAAAPSDAATASTPTSPWPPQSSPSVPCYGPPGTATAGTPAQDHHASADLLADVLSGLGLGTWATGWVLPCPTACPARRRGARRLLVGVGVLAQLVDLQAPLDQVGG